MIIAEEQYLGIDEQTYKDTMNLCNYILETLSNKVLTRIDVIVDRKCEQAIKSILDIDGIEVCFSEISYDYDEPAVWLHVVVDDKKLSRK